MRVHQEHPLRPGQRRSGDCTISAGAEKDCGRMAPIEFARPNESWLTSGIKSPAPARKRCLCAERHLFDSSCHALWEPGFTRIALNIKTSAPLGPSGRPQHARGRRFRSALPVAGQFHEKEIAEDFESL